MHSERKEWIISEKHFSLELIFTKNCKLHDSINEQP